MIIFHISFVYLYLRKSDYFLEKFFLSNNQKALQKSHVILYAINQNVIIYRSAKGIMKIVANELLVFRYILFTWRSHTRNEIKKFFVLI